MSRGIEVDFELVGLHVRARVYPAVRGRRLGHPDSWAPDDPGDVEVIAVDGESAPDENVTDQDIERAAIEAALGKIEGWRDRWLAEQELTA